MRSVQRVGGLVLRPFDATHVHRIRPQFLEASQRGFAVLRRVDLHRDDKAVAKFGHAQEGGGLELDPVQRVTGQSGPLDHSLSSLGEHLETLVVDVRGLLQEGGEIRHILIVVHRFGRE